MTKIALPELAAVVKFVNFTNTQTQMYCYLFRDFKVNIAIFVGVTNDSSMTKKNSPTIGNFKFGGAKFGPSVTGVQQGLGPSVSPAGTSIKRPPSGVSHPPPKKQKTGILREVTLSEAGKFGTLTEFAFFDKVRKALRNPEVYDNFLRCLVLFNQGPIL